jgi:hypothetical protein
MKFNTLEYNGTERTLLAWGIALNGLVGSFVNQRADTLRITIPGGNIADAEIFPFEAAIIFRTQRDSASGDDNSFSNGTVEFSGKRVGEVKDLRPAAQGVAYEFQGPWYDLEHTVYQQPFGSWQTGSLTYPFQSELLLFTRLNTTTGVLSFITNGAQMQDVLQFLLDQYSAQSMAEPFQIGTIDPALNLAPLPCKPMMCADTLLKCLELSPDCTVSFDYTYLPPKINVKSVYNLTPLTLPIADGVSHKSLRIVPRPDLRPRAVIVNFKITSAIDGVNFIAYAQEKYGPHGANNVADPDAGLRVIVDWIDLLGPASTSVSQTIKTAPLVATSSQTDLRDWWKDHDKQFADLRLRMQDAAGTATNFPDLTMTDAETGDPVSIVDYPRELVDGTVAPWMGFNVKRVKVSTVLTYVVYDKVGTSETDADPARGTLVKRFTEKEHHVEITVTNGSTGTYATTASTTTGEDIPADLAQGIWTALDRLQYEGDYVKVQAAINGGVSMLNTLNLSSGREEWATMNAQIQGIQKDYGYGETAVTIGPAKHLNVTQMMDIFRAWRFRLVTYNSAVRSTGNPGSSSSGTEIAKNTPKKNTMEGLENPSAQSVTYHDGDDPDGDLLGKLLLDPKIVSDNLDAVPSATPVSGFTDEEMRTLKPVELAICTPDGGLAFIQVLAGAPYTKP